jgi:polar amino acid transport system substrate-binding protein
MNDQVRRDGIRRRGARRPFGASATPLGLLVIGFVLVPICFALISHAASAQTLARISATKTVHIGFIPDQTPFANVGDDGKPTGYAIDLCNRVVDKIGQSVPGVAADYVQTSMVDAFKDVAAGRIDLLCGAVTITLLRREMVDFSQPIFITGMTALLRNDSPRDLRELFMGERGISPPRSPSLRPFFVSRVGVRSGTTTEAALRRAVTDGKYSTEVVGYATHAEGLAALEDRNIDAYFADEVLLAALLAQAQDPSGLVLGTRLVTREPYGIAMGRGDSDLRLLVDRVLTEFYATPEYVALLGKYFGAEASGIQKQISAQSNLE